MLGVGEAIRFEIGDMSKITLLSEIKAWSLRKYIVNNPLYMQRQIAPIFPEETDLDIHETSRKSGPSEDTYQT